MDSPRTRMYTHPFFEATPPGAAPGPPVLTGARVRHFRGCNNIGTDTDSYPPVFFRPLVTIGLYPVSAVRSVPLYYFSIQALGLNFASAQDDALSDFRRAGEVGDQLRSRIRDEYDSLIGETDLSFEEWAVVRVKQTSRNDLIESATGLCLMYKACTSFELSLRGKLEASAKKTKAGNVGAVRPGGSVAVNIETSVHLVLNVLAYVIPRYSLALGFDPARTKAY